MTKKITTLFFSTVLILISGLFSTSLFTESTTTGTSLSEAIKQVEMFSGLTEAEQKMLESVTVLKHFSAGERIITEGKLTQDMFVVLDSPVEVRVKNQTVTDLSPKILIGEIEFLDRKIAAADVIMSKESDVIIINNVLLRKLFDSNPRLGYVLIDKIAGLLAVRLRAMDEKN